MLLLFYWWFYVLWNVIWFLNSDFQCCKGSGFKLESKTFSPSKIRAASEAGRIKFTPQLQSSSQCHCIPLLRFNNFIRITFLCVMHRKEIFRSDLIIYFLFFHFHYIKCNTHFFVLNKKKNKLLLSITQTEFNLIVFFNSIFDSILKNGLGIKKRLKKTVWLMMEISFYFQQFDWYSKFDFTLVNDSNYSQTYSYHLKLIFCSTKIQKCYW